MVQENFNCFYGNKKRKRSFKRSFKSYIKKNNYSGYSIKCCIHLHNKHDSIPCNFIIMNKYLILSLSILILYGCNDMNSNIPPKPKKIPHELKAHGDTRIDNYYWMRDDSRSDPELIAYLETCLLYTSPSPRDSV